VDAARLEQLLRAQGFVAHRRTIQRDLVALARVFPIRLDRRSKPYGWCWAEGAFPGPLPTLDGGRASPQTPTSIALRLRARVEVAPAVGSSLGLAVLAPGLAGPSDEVHAAETWVLLEGFVADGEALRRRLLALGEDVVVLAPAALRARVARSHLEAALRYGVAGRAERDEVPSAP
jgi:hypothetical protein